MPHSPINPQCDGCNFAMPSVGDNDQTNAKIKWSRIYECMNPTCKLYLTPFRLVPQQCFTWSNEAEPDSA